MQQPSTPSRIQIQFRCSTCGQINTRQVGPEDLEVPCANCQAIIRSSPEVWVEGRPVRCLVCPGKELFVRKDFPQRLGLGILVVGFAVSCLTWYCHWILATYAILFCTAGVDALLYLLVGDVVECYNCHALYRGGLTQDRYAAFDLEIHEKYRQQQARRMELLKSRDDREPPRNHEPDQHAIY